MFINTARQLIFSLLVLIFENERDPGNELAKSWLKLHLTKFLLKQKLNIKHAFTFASIDYP